MRVSDRLAVDTCLNIVRHTRIAPLIFASKALLLTITRAWFAPQQNGRDAVLLTYVIEPLFGVESLGDD